MASISSDSNGRRIIQFVGADRKRRSIRVGKMSKRKAESIRQHIEDLNVAKIAGHSIPRDTAKWLSEIGDDLHNRLVRAQLADTRERKSLADFLDECIKKRKRLKPRTLDIFRRARNNLVDYFGADKAIDSITVGDANDWREHLLEKGGCWGKPLAENTVRDRSKKARQMFRVAIDHEMIDRNPFQNLPGTVTCNEKKLYFVTRDETSRLLEACPDFEWRILIALCRFGGLRNPSETLSLRWEHVDWAHNRMTVPSPKTEHHENGEYRIIPIFAELRPYLELAWDEAEEGDEFVITRWRDQATNLRTQIHRIIRRAGLQPWPRVFHNMRSTRQTELEDQFPSHVVCRWIGNSEQIARKHYLQVTLEHFERAAREESALQNPVQILHAGPREVSQSQNADE